MGRSLTGPSLKYLVSLTNSLCVCFHENIPTEALKLRCESVPEQMEGVPGLIITITTDYLQY